MPGQSSAARQHQPNGRLTWRPVAGLISEKIGDEVLVLDQRAGRIHQFNHTAAIVWNGLSGRQTLAAIATRIAERYDVPEFRAEKDAVRMIEQLQVLKLITADESN